MSTTHLCCRRLPLAILIPAALVAAVGLSLLLDAPDSSADEEGIAGTKPSVKGVLYEVFHGDLLCWSRGTHIREVHLPDLGLSYHVVNRELRVFRPEVGRYGGRESMTWTRMDASGTRQRVKLRVCRIPGTEPRRVREVEVAAEDAERLREFLSEHDRLRDDVGKYLR